jgi:putative aldouronate transport system substrate-binding protein
MRMKGFLVVFAVVLLLVLPSSVAMSSGTSEAKGPKLPKELGVAVNPAGVFPIAKERTKLSILLPQRPSVLDYKDNYLTQVLQEKANVDLEFVLVPSEEFDQKLNLMIAGGQTFPDIVSGDYFSFNLIAQYGADGRFLPLNALIDKYGTEVKKQMAEINSIGGQDWLKTMTMPDGNIYGLTSPYLQKWVDVSNRLWVRKAWLEKLGIDKNKVNTLAEFKEMLKAFKTRDPNGNGIADEIPMMGAVGGWATVIEGYLMDPFTPYDSYYLDRRLWNHKTGEVEFAPLKPEWFEGVKYISGLVAEGLIDPLSFSQSVNELRVVGAKSNPPIVGAFPAANFQFLPPDLKSKQWLEYTTLPPLNSPRTGKKQTYENRVAMEYYNALIPSSTKNAALAFRFLDLMLSEEITMINRYGKKGVDWIPNTSLPNYRGEMKSTFEEIGQWGAPTKTNWHAGVLYNLSLSLNAKLGIGESSDGYYIRGTKDYLPYGAFTGDLPLLFTQAEGEELSELEAAIKTYVNQSFAAFCLGKMPLEDYGKFIEKLKSMGIEKALKVRAEAYKRRYLSASK